MLTLFKDVGNYIKSREINTDCIIFRMHCRWTMVILLVFSLVITASELVGDPISCIESSKAVPEKVLNTFCWITSTFTMADGFYRKVGVDVAQPGIQNDYGNEKNRKYYKYYQWVCFALFFQAMLCYLPHWLWSVWEGGVIKQLASGLTNGVCNETDKKKQKTLILQYVRDHFKMHKIYVYRYFVCEMLCLLNIIGQLYLMNRFFDGEFLSYGLRVIRHSENPQEERVDPMIYIFPRVTKCIFYKGGSSGSIQNHDTMCVLPLNIVNEKTYIFIWFWYMILCCLLVCLIAYRVLLVLTPSFRSWVLHASTRTLSKETCRSVSMKTDSGDWWILYMLSANMDSLIYRDLLESLAKNMSDDSSDKLHY